MLQILQISTKYFHRYVAYEKWLHTETERCEQMLDNNETA